MSSPLPSTTTISPSTAPTCDANKLSRPSTDRPSRVAMTTDKVGPVTSH
jgi:hypothetical protein